MEGPSMEWEIEEEYHSCEENSGDKGIWMLKLGKKVLVTGFVISSAPLLLPPLVVISAIGFAFSVPYGLFLATYACTDNLMAKLLPPRPAPTPTPTPDEGDELCEKQNEEVDEEGEVLVEYIYETETVTSVEKDVKESVVDEIVEEEDIGESLDEEEDDIDKPLQRNGVLIEGIAEESRDEQAVVEGVSGVVIGIEVDEKSGDSVEETSIVVVEELCQAQGSDIKEENEEIVSETRGLLEQIRDEGKTDNVVVEEEDKQSVEKMYGGAEEISRHGEEIGIPFEDRNVYGNVSMEKPMREIEQQHRYREEIPKESEERQKMGYRENVDTVINEKKTSAEIGGLSEKNDIDSVLETEKSEAETSGTINVGSIVEADQKPVVDKAAMLQGERTEDNVANDIEQYFQLNKEKEIVISSNADAREIADESGFDLFDNKNEAGQLYSYANCDTAEESEQFSSNMAYDADIMELTICTGENESRSAAISSEKHISMASNKVLYNEEKIWEQIDAMRTIVGYKATRHASCIEELKGLYLFTGVEPPASFMDPSDLVEINDKLRFLMSIIGVK